MTSTRGWNEPMRDMNLWQLTNHRSGNCRIVLHFLHYWKAESEDHLIRRFQVKLWRQFAPLATQTSNFLKMSKHLYVAIKWIININVKVNSCSHPFKLHKTWRSIRPRMFIIGGELHILYQIKLFYKIWIHRWSDMITLNEI